MGRVFAEIVNGDYVVCRETQLGKTVGYRVQHFRSARYYPGLRKTPLTLSEAKKLRASMNGTYIATRSYYERPKSGTPQKVWDHFKKRHRKLQRIHYDRQLGMWLAKVGAVCYHVRPRHVR